MSSDPVKTEGPPIAKVRSHIWRQGSVLPENAAAELEVIAGSDHSHFAIVITHDCDCVAELAQESFVELVFGTQIEKLDGNFTHGKNPRKLHLELSLCNKLVELVITPKLAISKIDLFAFGPNAEFVLSNQEKTVLSRWLASRYNRPAFPDELVERLRVINDDFRKAARKYGEAAIGIFVDFEPNSEIENKEEPYAIGISVVFDANRQNAQALSVQLRDALRFIFEKTFRKTHGRWKSIELASCEAIADTEFTYFEAMKSCPYRLDDLSLRRAPHDPLPI